MNTNIICKILKNNTQFLLLNKECFFKKYLFLFLFENKQKLFTQACKYNQVEVVKLLLQDPIVDQSNKNNKAIIFASRYGFLEVVELLLQDSRVDPSGNYNDAIRLASTNGHLRCKASQEHA